MNPVRARSEGRPTHSENLPILLGRPSTLCPTRAETDGYNKLQDWLQIVIGTPPRISDLAKCEWWRLVSPHQKSDFGLPAIPDILVTDNRWGIHVNLRTRKPTKVLVAALTSAGVVASMLVASTGTAAAASTPVLKRLSNLSAYDSEKAVIKPKYFERWGYQVQSATVTVKRGKRTVGKGKQVKVAPGKYKVNQELRYRKRLFVNKTSWMKKRTVDLEREGKLTWDTTGEDAWCVIKAIEPVTDLYGPTGDNKLWVDCRLPRISIKALTGIMFVTDQQFEYEWSVPTLNVGDKISHYKAGTLDPVSLDAQNATLPVTQYGPIITNRSTSHVIIRNKNRKCVSQAERKKLRKGMSKTRVNRILGGNGKRLGLGYNVDEARGYKRCSSWPSSSGNHFAIGYKNRKVKSFFNYQIYYH